MNFNGITGFTHLFHLIVITFVSLIAHCLAQQLDEQNLVINVRNYGQEVYQEVIAANTSEDVIRLEFYQSDGSFVTQLIDFKAEVQIYRMIRLGEQDLDESLYKVFCFVTHFQRNEFISSDSMSKLRQRNPGAIRQPEEDKGIEFYEMDLNVELDKSSIISAHLPQLCADALNTTFAREIDLRFWANSKVFNRDIISLTSSVRKNLTSKPVRCMISESYGKPCLCHLQMCIAWYPCSLKYCKSKDPSTQKMISSRCGIKTCRKCSDFQFYSQTKRNCLWDL